MAPMESTSAQRRSGVAILETIHLIVLGFAGVAAASAPPDKEAQQRQMYPVSRPRMHQTGQRPQPLCRSEAQFEANDVNEPPHNG